MNDAGRDENRWSVHRAVFRNDIEELTRLLTDGPDLSEKDPHGNTPLHIAVMMGFSECVQLLLEHKSPIKIKNNAGWSPLAEAISYGNRDTIMKIMRNFRRETSEIVQSRRGHLISALEGMDDFRLVLKWDFQSWVPFLSRILPSDICTISKKGSSLRLDTTLVDFSEMRWVRGDVSFLYVGSAPPSESLTVLDNQARVFQRIRYENNEKELDKEINLLMSNDIITADISTKSITFTRAQAGWIWREDRSENVGSFPAHYYHVSGLVLRTRKRREHLSEEDMMKNKAIVDSLTTGRPTDGVPDPSDPTTQESNQTQSLSMRFGGDSNENQRQSLEPPPVPNISWDDYVSRENVHLGREMLTKESKSSFKLTLAMSEEFPITVPSLLDVLEVIAPLKHFRKLRDFVDMKLPPGFPVKIELPVLPAITARVTFQNFNFSNEIDENLFRIPIDFVEDPNRFPDL